MSDPTEGSPSVVSYRESCKKPDNLEGELEMATAKSKIKVKTKLKTRKSAAKRMKVTGTGKVMRRKGWKGHLLSGKNSTRKRRLSGAVEITKENRENARRMVPYKAK
jgi:large subunit ribosomal protein L35